MSIKKQDRDFLLVLNMFLNYSFVHLQQVWQNITCSFSYTIFEINILQDLQHGACKKF